MNRYTYTSYQPSKQYALGETTWAVECICQKCGVIPLQEIYRKIEWYDGLIRETPYCRTCDTNIAGGLPVDEYENSVYLNRV